MGKHWLQTKQPVRSNCKRNLVVGIPRLWRKRSPASKIVRAHDSKHARTCAGLGRKFASAAYVVLVGARLECLRPRRQQQQQQSPQDCSEKTNNMRATDSTLKKKCIVRTKHRRFCYGFVPFQNGQVKG